MVLENAKVGDTVYARRIPKIGVQYDGSYILEGCITEIDADGYVVSLDGTPKPIWFSKYMGHQREFPPEYKLYASKQAIVDALDEGSIQHRLLTLHEDEVYGLRIGHLRRINAILDEAKDGIDTEHVARTPEEICAAVFAVCSEELPDKDERLFQLQKDLIDAITWHECPPPGGWTANYQRQYEALMKMPETEALPAIFRVFFDNEATRSPATLAEEIANKYNSQMPWDVAIIDKYLA